MSDEHIASAKQCLSVAVKALKEGDTEKAKRFVDKSIRLHPTPEAQKLQRQLLGQPEEPSPRNKDHQTHDQPRGHAGGSRRKSTETQHPGGEGRAGPSHHDHRQANGTGGHHGTRARAASPSGTPSESSAPPATPEQLELVNRIRKTECYYTMLGVAKTADEKEIKNAYRKLALKLHPDKNRAPGAEEAFKSVSRAFHCLSTPSLRTNYDRYGSEKGPVAQPGHNMGMNMGGVRYRQGGPGVYYGGMEDDIDPEFIFRTFFGGDPFFAAAFGGPGMNMHVRRRMAEQQRRRQQPRRQEDSDSDEDRGPAPINMGNLLLRLAPLLFFLLNTPLLTFLFGESTPSFQFERTRSYPFEQISQRYRIPYYVQDHEAFGSSYPHRSHKRQKYEAQVEQEYFNVLQQRCAREYTNYAAYRRWSMKPPEDWRAHACEELTTRFRHDPGYRFQYEPAAAAKPAVADGEADKAEGQPVSSAEVQQQHAREQGGRREEEMAAAAAAPAARAPGGGGESGEL